AVIGCPAPGKRHHGTVVEVIVPERVKAVPTALWWADQFRVLWFVLGHEEGGASMGCVSHAASYGCENMIRGGIVDVLSGIQAQAVEVKFLDPVAGIGNEKLAHRTGMLVCIVNRWAPVRGVAIRKIFWGELRQKIAVWSHMVVDHIQDHAQPQCMCP